MKFISTFSLEFESNITLDIYFNLLIEEDFDFKSKNIRVNFEKQDSFIKVFVSGDSILDLKIATNALIKTLEVIEKTLNI